MRTIRSPAGQGSIEYVGLIALVAALIVISGAALAHASDISRRVSREWARALCLVRDGDCRRDQEPCVLSSDEEDDRSHVNVGIFRFGGGKVVLTERLSDGRWRVTKTTEDLDGLDAGVGVEAGVKVKGVDLSLAAELRAGAMGLSRDGRSWFVSSRAAADDLVDRLRQHEIAELRRRRAPPGEVGAPIPPPDVEYGEDGTDATADASAIASVLGEDVAEAGASGRLSELTGRRTDRHTGRTTHYVRASRAAQAALTGGLGVGASAGGELYAVELDPAGRPVDLTIVAAVRYDGSRDLPAVLQPVAGRIAVPTDGERTVEVTSHLDLTEPRNLEAARGMLRAITANTLLPGRAVAASEALRARLAQGATVEARVLDQAASGWNATLHVAGGLKLGAGRSHEERSARLIAAVSRGLDGQWLMRDDCAAAA